MILIIKFQNESTTVFDRLADNGGIPQPIDALLISKVLSSNFPVFNVETETAGGITERKAGEFGCSFSLYQTETSFNGDSLNTFFRGGTRAYKYLIVIEEGATQFHGIFQNSDLDFDLTTSQGRCDVSLLARDTIEEFAIFLDTLNSAFQFSELTQLSFETYMSQYHLKDFNVTYDGTLSNKVGVSTYFNGAAYVNGISQATDLRTVTRLETFKELSKGLAFTYYLTVNTDLTQLYNSGSANWFPRSFMDVNIRWLRDGGFVFQSDMRIESTKVHKERVLPKAKQYVFMGYRNIISTSFPEVDTNDFTAVRGIMYDGTTFSQSDSSDNLNPIYAQYPFFAFSGNDDLTINTLSGNVTIMANQFGYFRSLNDYDIINSSDVNFIEMTLYNYTQLGGGTTAGSCAYARVFNTTSGFLPLQQFVINQYRRYIMGSGKKVKDIKIPIESDTELTVYKPIVLTDDQGEGVYYISKMRDLDLQNRDVGLELTQV